MNNIQRTKKYRVEIQKLIDSVKNDHEIKCRECSIALTKLEESKMWLGKVLNHLGAASPYVESENVNNSIVTPEVDMK